MSKNRCHEYEVYRYTWPGRDESSCCETHAVKLRNVANAIGLHLQLIPIGDDQIKGLCEQIVKDNR